MSDEPTAFKSTTPASGVILVKCVQSTKHGRLEVQSTADNLEELKRGLNSVEVGQLLQQRSGMEATVEMALNSVRPQHAPAHE